MLDVSLIFVEVIMKLIHEVSHEALMKSQTYKQGSIKKFKIRYACVLVRLNVNAVFLMCYEN